MNQRRADLREADLWGDYLQGAINLTLRQRAEMKTSRRLGHLESFLTGVLGYNPDHGDPYMHGLQCREKLLNAIQLTVISQKQNLPPVSTEEGQVDCS